MHKDAEKIEGTLNFACPTLESYAVRSTANVGRGG